jgi:excisionase family DNA binding protein
MVRTREMTTAPRPDLMTRSEAARILCVSPTTVTRWAREGRLACRLTLGGHHRFERGVIETVRELMEHGLHEEPGARGH